MKQWTTLELIEWTAGHFKSKGIESSRLDAELLLASTLQCRRLDLYLRFDEPMSEGNLEKFRALVARRAKREPVAYILGKQDFYNRTFGVSPAVLIPRPETEMIVEAALLWAHSQNQKEIKVLDVGCGSGALGITLALEDPRFSVHCIELSSEACQVAMDNVRKHAVQGRMEVLNQNFETWSPTGLYDLIVSNPPYISRDGADSLSPDVRDFEPGSALYGGPMGHEILEVWIPKMTQHLVSGGLLLCEIGYDQEAQVKALGEEIETLVNQKVNKDLAGHPRLFMAQKT